MKKYKDKLFSKFIISISLVFLVFVSLAFPKKVQAQFVVTDPGTWAASIAEVYQTIGGWALENYWRIEAAVKDKLSAEMLHSVLSTAINKMAFETATWLGNGDKGEKPMFLTEDKGTYLKNMADNAAGQFIEQVSKEAFGDSFNLCEPDINVKVLIGLGLTQPKLTSSNCSFTKMKNNWEKEVLDNKNFLSDINNYFEMGGDLGVSLSLNEQQANAVKLAHEKNTLDLIIGQGYKEVKDPISGKVLAPPGTAKSELEAARRRQEGGLLVTTQDLFVDAAKVFSNQYFITLFNRKMRELGKGMSDTSSPLDKNALDNKIKALVDPNADVSSNGSENTSAKLMELVKPNFQVSADFEVLTKLTMCLDPTSAATTDCVIDNNFSSAITENLTVGQSLQKGYLNQNGKFGFIVEYVNNNYQCYDKEPSYIEGYPYRSMLILRKYRILPVGWELAAQYIHDTPQNTHSCTLGDMVACFDADDEFRYVSNNCIQGGWCRGLVDPNWVLTVPKHVCRSSGPGPNISYYGVTKTDELTSSINVKRADYCADEQSCIYEKNDGNCEVYGYCVEEKRKWNFGTDSCDPNFNSCETYRDSSGKSVSYLENTLDNSVCNSENVGCTDYCEDYSLDAASIPMFTLEQNGVTYNLPATFSTVQTAATFYNYTAASFNQPSMYSMLAEDKSVIFVHFDTANERFSVGMFHDYPNSIFNNGCDSNLAACQSLPNGTNCDCDGGNVSFTFTNISAGNSVAVADDPGEIPAPGTELVAGDTWNWGYSPCCTDGGMIDMPNGNWSVTIRPNSFVGLNRWVLAYEGGEIPLNMSAPITISKNIVNGNFTCLADGGDKLYLDNDVKPCDADNEGCHQYIRTKSGLGTNLVTNSGFEDNQVGDVAVFGGGSTVHLGNPAIGWMANRNGTDLSVSIVSNNTGQVHSGTKSALINTSSWDGIGSYDSHIQGFSRFPVGFNMRLGATYTLSAWVFVQSGTVQIGAGRTGGTGYRTAMSNSTNTWERLSVSFINDASLAANEFFIYGTSPGAQFYVDDIQFEEGLDLTNYKDYAQTNVVYEKILPNYLAVDCYRNPATDYRFKDNHPSACDNFARLCNEDEVGCDMYTSVNTDISVPAKVEVEDYCVAECVGYDQYMQHPTYFSSFLPKYFIPTTARDCDAGSVGCEEFTNLDNVSAGGETREYYSYLRQCVKPGQAGSNCGEFYTWEGSSETGFQLRVHNLQIDDDSDDGGYTHPEARYDNDPAVTEYDYVSCNELIYRLNLNSDCREFYNRNGELSYHLYTDTITCSADCHNFRMTKNNVVKDPATGANISWPDCQALSNYSDYHDIITNAEFTARGGECVFCKNGGTWNSGSGSCLYNAIPAEGVVCSKEVSGCREYSGNTGSSIYNVSISNFEGSTQDWEGIGATTVITDSDSLRVNEEALRVQVAPYTIAQTVGTSVQQGKSYYLEFIAKAITASEFSAIYLTNGPDMANFATDPSLSMTLDGQYKIFKLNLASLDHTISDVESLVIRADGGFMIDDIKLVEITDRYYVIEDSWQTPETCFQDIYGNPVGQLVNLGCDEYTDRAGGTFYIHNFPTMCQESAVGCEALIDTYNYSDYRGINFHTGDASAEVIPADGIVYAVYDNSKSCFANDKGCQILGKPYDYANSTVYRPLYLINDPDSYANTLCFNNEKSCKSWTSREGNVYFKDPGDQTCEYRLESDSGGKKTRDWGWFKTSVKRCDGDANGAVVASDNICLESTDCNLTNMVCKADADCGANNVCISGFCRNACINDKNDYPCPTTNNVTIGTGGEGARINTPTVDGNYVNWVGNCPSSLASCTEYLDPVSNFSVNLLANANFSNLPSIVYNTSWYCHGNTSTVCTTDANCPSASNNDYCVNNVWRGSGTNYTQAVKLNRNYLYRLALRNNDAGATLNISCASPISEFDSVNNELGSVVNSLTVSNLNVNDINNRFFYVPDGAGSILCTVQATGINVGGSDYVELKQVIVSYQLETGLDKSSCNGVVNRNEGCVLFNERKVNSKNLSNIVYSAVSYDADNTVYGSSPAACSGQDCNSNQILKVTPDRTCDKWLACTGTSQSGQSGDSVCDGIGICDKLDKNGNCERFVASINTNYIYSPAISGIYTAGDIYNMSGYVKVGYSGTMVNRDTTRKSDDKFNFGSMRPYGGQTQILNNSFESTKENRCSLTPSGTLPTPTLCGVRDYPADFDNKVDASEDWGDPDYVTDWNCEPTGSNKCEVIDDPVENEKEKICYIEDRDTTCKIYAPDGRNYLKLISDNEGAALATSSAFSVTPNTDYVFSFFVNTLRLSNGRAQVRVYEYDEDGNQSYIWQKLINYRLGWRKETSTFRSSATARTMIIVLSAINRPQGNVYFDKFDIKESLHSRDGIDPEDAYETKDCRLYPKDDALSCDYYENGIRYQGWTGYCLEYDRYPGWSNACLQWWSIPSSVDSVNAWCGDNKVGDDEDCDCQPDANGNESYSCPSQASLYGTAVNNQYHCENCTWTQGWCGDNYVDVPRGEDCDWNDSIRSDPPGSQPNKNLGSYNGATVPVTCENLSYVNVAFPNTMFTDGNLGCYSHDGGANYSSINPVNNRRCTYDISYGDGSYTGADPSSDPVDNPSLTGFGCTISLADLDYSDAISPHTAENCINAGGVVVSEIVNQVGVPASVLGGAMVINSSRDTVVGNPDFGRTFCKFTGSWAGSLGASGICASISGGGGNWHAFLTNSTPWTRTPSSCTAHISCSGPPCVHSMSNVSSSHNYFENLGIENASVSNSNCSYDGFSCGSESNSCVTTVTEIGCY